MGNAIYISIRASIALILIWLTVQSFGCKKKKEEPAQQQQQSSNNTVATPDSIYYSSTVNSNYLKSYLIVENTTDNTVIKKINGSGGQNLNCPFTYSFWAKKTKSYRVYSYSTKNGGDSTFNVTDNLHVWNKLTITTGTSAATTVYNVKDSIGSGAWPICSNTYTFSVN